jgi:neurofibromin 1
MESFPPVVSLLDSSAVPTVAVASTSMDCVKSSSTYSVSTTSRSPSNETDPRSTVSDSIKVRDGVKDVLGSDLSHLQYPIFFKHLYSIVGHFLDNERATVTEDGFTVFIEQTISVLRLMFDRLVEPLSKLATTTLDGLLLSFTIYVQRLGTSLHANRLKIRLCQLCEVVLVKRGPATLERDSAFRNELVEHLVSWSSDSQPVSTCLCGIVERRTDSIGSQQSNSEDGYERLRRDLDAACLKAMVASLNGLVVHSAEVDRAQPVKTNARRKSIDRRVAPSLTMDSLAVFSRYFDFFSYTLQRLGDPQVSPRSSISLYRPDKVTCSSCTRTARASSRLELTPERIAKN